MRKYGLIGHPLGHSLSPQIHSRLFELSGIKADYQLYDISPEELQSRFDFLGTLDGFNITIPHKTGIIAYCDELSDGARRYSSVNCVSNAEKKTGHNTDCTGFVKSIEMMGASLSSRVLSIGCGGVGRMIAIETALSGGELTIAALESDLPLAEKAAAEIKSQGKTADIAVIRNGCLDMSVIGDKRFDLLINASPVGMFPKTDAMPCSEDVLDAVSAVFDVVYNPKETMLVGKAREKGKKALNGMAMLVLQAAAAHEIWYGASFRESDLDKLITDMENLI